MAILVTGGAGYIGTHTVVELLQAGLEAVVADNLVNSNAEALHRVSELTGKKVAFYRCDVRDGNAIERIFSENKIDCVIHFAGLKAVGESVRFPLAYYDNNLVSTLVLLQTMAKHSVKRIIFSSSATVYGKPERLPLDENCCLSATNPYGATKLMQEEILRDAWNADHSWNIALLRYFNPVGAHPSGRIGEDPRGIPNNLMPYVAQVACGRLPSVGVFGNDYPTLDGTGVRDYIHVVDLARGHLAALRKLREPGVHIYNLGTGRGYSVLELIRAFERACGKKIPYEIKPRRAGDVAVCYASCGKAEKELGWKAEYDLDDMCRDQWNWQKNNPNGYSE